MKFSPGYFISILSQILIFGCIDPYFAPIKEEDVSHLVVDGVINASDGVATIKLSRSTSIVNDSLLPELGATVSIEDHMGNSIVLDETPNGVYSKKTFFPLDAGYRLKIQANGKNYYSKQIELVKNGQIDSLTWRIENDQFNVYSSSHNGSSPIGYYKYSLIETYEYRAPLFSFYRYENGSVVNRLPDDDIYRCWMTNPVNNNILVASSENQSQNAILNFKVHSIQKGDKRLWNKYSLLVNQIAIEKSAYEYWSQLRNVNEGVGGLFDPIPYSVKGNIYSESDPSEVVLGYFYGGEVTQKRIVISNLELPNGFENFVQTTCTEDYVPVENLSSLEGKNVEITIHRLNLTTIIGYYYTKPICADCRLQGGTNIVPDFMK